MWRLTMGAAALALAFAGAAGAAQASPNAHGSVEQVYVTGLSPGAKATLLDSHGDKVATRAANPLGGLLFRGVKPGSGYRVRAGSVKSGPLKVLSERAAPPDTRIYSQQIPANGYGYLTTR